MAKPQMKLKVRLPVYHRPRNQWRREIHRVVAQELRRVGIRYTGSDRFEVAIRLYFAASKLKLIDIDNRVKDILDALQGHVGGASKKRRMVKALIPNENQIFRIIAEKSLPPWQSDHGRGHLMIRRYRGPNYR
jgi:Holliday junction resolvase RusA-like endonuclease